VWTEEDDVEIEYGKWHQFDAKTCLAEEHKVRPREANDDIWPHWSEGRPTFLRRNFYSDSFYNGRVHHRSRECYASLELKWSPAHALSFLRKNYRFLPGTHSREWSGVYRVFSPHTIIDRFCGKDPTGTLYLGLAGTGEMNWSILRNRIQSVVKKEHHATQNWMSSELISQKYPWESLHIEWAFTGERKNGKGELVPAATRAEGWLLWCYNDSYGEFPPLNQKG
jgi:hypothetical protein